MVSRNFQMFVIFAILPTKTFISVKLVKKKSVEERKNTNVDTVGKYSREKLIWECISKARISMFSGYCPQMKIPAWFKTIISVLLFISSTLIFFRSFGTAYWILPYVLSWRKVTSIVNPTLITKKTLPPRKERCAELCTSVDILVCYEFRNIKHNQLKLQLRQCWYIRVKRCWNQITGSWDTAIADINWCLM